MTHLNRVHNINDYLLVMDYYKPEEGMHLKTKLDKEYVGLTFYAAGNFSVDISKDNRTLSTEEKNPGFVYSFYFRENVEIGLRPLRRKPVKKISIFLNRDKVESLQSRDQNHSHKLFGHLLSGKNIYSKGEKLPLTPKMYALLDRFFDAPYKGLPLTLFYEAQILELLFYYLQLIERSPSKEQLQKTDVDKLHYARELLLENLEEPPSLENLARLTGLNTFKLKTGFKKLFGRPVFKYLQEKRLEKAFELLENKEMNVQEVAWFVGYESIGSFSNAFYKKFGYRPSDIKK